MTDYITLPKQAKDIAGQRFGRLVALGPIENTPPGRIKWLCQCNCGRTTVAAVYSLRDGHTRSCGCLRDELIAGVRKTHGMAGDPLYATWCSIVKRCTNPNDKDWHLYGGRGITICDEWRHDFLGFYNHVSVLPHCGEEGYSIDRMNNSLGYSPGNVRWATSTEQSRNRRHNRLLTYDGETQGMSVWAEEKGMPPSRLARRLRLGWSVERALTEPRRGEKQ